MVGLLLFTYLFIRKKLAIGLPAFQLLKLMILVYVLFSLTPTLVHNYLFVCMCRVIKGMLIVLKFI